jgi:hypothetical protein
VKEADAVVRHGLLLPVLKSGQRGGDTQDRGGVALDVQSQLSGASGRDVCLIRILAALMLFTINKVVLADMMSLALASIDDCCSNTLRTTG